MVLRPGRQKNGDFVPQSPPVFLEWVRGIIAYITPDRAEQWGIPESIMKNIGEKFLLLEQIHAEMGTDPTRAQTTRRKSLQVEITHYIRELVRFYLRRKGVPNDELVAMGIPVVDKTRTPRTRVDEMVDFNFKSGQAISIIIDFWQAHLTDSFARPKGSVGAKFLWKICDSQPNGIDDYNNSALLTHRPYRFAFDESVRGRKVWFTAAWQGSRGILGEFSPPKAAFVP